MIVPQTHDERKCEIARIVARLVELTDVEQQIYARDNVDCAQLAAIVDEREQLLEQKRALMSNVDLSAQPQPSPAPRVSDRKLVERSQTTRQRSNRDLPPGVERMPSGRLRVLCYIPPNNKLSVGVLEYSPENVELAGAMARAARDARLADMGESQIRAAAIAAYRDMSTAGAAD